MALTKEEVEHTAKLARLDLTEEEKSKFTEQLNELLAHAEKLNELNTDHVEPTTHGMDISNVMREDELRTSLPVEKMMLNAPDQEDGQYRVPAVLE